jgi:dTMP kinase
MSGRALALAVAADRYGHLENEIIPGIEAERYVVSDRYVQSSLVLQRLDGLSIAEIWRYNAHVVPPTLSVYLEETPEVISERLAQRRRLSRMELVGSPRRELALYESAFRFLRRKRWRQLRIHGQGRPPELIVAEVLDHCSWFGRSAAHHPSMAS